MKLPNCIPLLPILLAVACRPQSQPGTPTLAPEVVPVKLAAVQLADLEPAIEVTGLLTTENEARYSFKIGGVIDRIYVREGQAIKKGQRLAALKITEIGAQREHAEIGLEKARRDYARAASLHRDSVATLEQLQNAQTALDLAQKALQVVAFNEQYAYIVAHESGLVTARLANEGEVVAPGTPVLATHQTSGTQGWMLRLGLNDQEWASLAPGNPATVRLDAFPGRVFKGAVLRKQVAADRSSGTFEVDVAVDLEGLSPSVGMFGKARIVRGSIQKQTVVPYQALIEADGDEAYVFVPRGADSVRRVPVRIGPLSNDRVVVLSGLDDHARIVVSNSAFLNEKSKIKIIP